MEDQLGEKRITVRMMEAYFNAIPNVINYMKLKAKTDTTAARVLKKFVKDCENERNIPDPAEVVFGFAAKIAALDPQETFGSGLHPQRISDISAEFCIANELGMPAPGYANRLAVFDVPKLPEEKRIITLK